MQTIKDVKIVDIALVDPVALEKRSVSNSKTRLMKVTDSVNVDKIEAEKAKGVLEKKPFVVYSHYLNQQRFE